MPDRLEVVVFDVLETLLNLDPLAARLENVGQPAALLGPWFMRLASIEDGSILHVFE